ncbi:MAG TPA: putative glycoside hydrolase [Terriglobales bacterium]|nr:putative glycoside hydrolase [Terriglobales bacterium]
MMSRTLRLSALAALVCSLFVAIFVVAVPHYRLVAASGPAAKAGSSPFKTVSAPAPATAVAPAAPVVPPGSILFTAKRGQTMDTLVHSYLSQSSFMTGTEFRAAVRSANPELSHSVYFKADEPIIVPGMDVTNWSENAIPVPKDYEVRAIYLTGTMAGSEKGINLVRAWRKAGGNAVVFDVKDSDGIINIPFDHKLVPTGHKPVISNLPKYTRFLHAQRMHAIARIAIFRDQWMAENRSQLAVHSRRSGQPWRENGKLVWIDPSNSEYQDYIIALARHAAESGVDEIQFDYVRFPAEGDQKDAKFAFEAKHPEWKRADVIADFLTRAYSELHQDGVLVSLDVFGVMAWQRPIDLSHTGQDIVRMAKACDILSPMIYPSHFFGMDGYKAPGDAPEHFISESMDRFRLITKESGVVLRPWLQAFAWRTKTYSPQYIETQVAVAKEKGGIGFLFWNARNDYSKPFAAMPDMRSNRNGRFLRGDELPANEAKAAVKTITS